MNKELIDLLNAVKSVIAWHDLLFIEEPCKRWTVYFMALIRSSDIATSHEICRTLELAPRYEQLFCEERFAAQNCLSRMELALPATASELYRCNCTPFVRAAPLHDGGHAIQSR
jgi:tRNA nucleotidyltransferase (CCA-adding enzyme)